MTERSHYSRRARKSSGGKRKVVDPTDRRPGQPGGRRDENRKERVRELSFNAMRLFLERGVNETSIDDITQAAGVAKGSFYRYFESKEALVEELIRPVGQDIISALERCGRDLATANTPEAMFAHYRVLGEALAATILGHMEVVRLYLQESRGAPVGARVKIVSLQEQIGKAAIDVTVKAQGHGVLRPIHPSVSTFAVVGALERIMVGLLNGEDVGNPLEIPEALITLILYGLRAPDAPAPQPSR